MFWRDNVGVGDEKVVAQLNKPHEVGWDVLEMTWTVDDCENGISQWHQSSLQRQEEVLRFVLVRLKM